MSKLARGKDVSNNTKNDFEYLEMLENYFSNSIGTTIEKFLKNHYRKILPKKNSKFSKVCS